MDHKQFAKKVKKLIAKNKNERAIDLLIGIAETENNTELLNQVIYISSMYKAIKRKELLDLPFDNRLKNQLTYSLIEISSQIGKNESFELNPTTFEIVNNDFGIARRDRITNQITFYLGTSTLLILIVSIAGIEFLIILILLAILILNEGELEP